MADKVCLKEDKDQREERQRRILETLTAETKGKLEQKISTLDEIRTKVFNSYIEHIEMTQQYLNRNGILAFGDIEVRPELTELEQLEQEASVLDNELKTIRDNLNTVLMSFLEEEEEIHRLEEMEWNHKLKLNAMEDRISFLNNEIERANIYLNRASRRNVDKNIINVIEKRNMKIDNEHHELSISPATFGNTNEGTLVCNKMKAEKFMPKAPQFSKFINYKEN